MAEPTSVAVAEDSYLVREGLRRALEDTGELDVVAAVGTAEELLDVVDRLEPAAVVTDIRMPPGNTTEGIEAARKIRLDHPSIGVVVLSQHVDGHYALELFRDGTEGLAYLLKERIGEIEQLVQAVQTVATGGSVIDPRVVDALVAERSGSDRTALDDLTEREHEVLAAMARGMTNAMIADDLHISQSSVEKHATAIFSKLGFSSDPGVHRRVAAVVEFLRVR
ncbi:MAG: response regulator transcription factor [Nitriliruptorales bacterium]|nr:response regulator transcription factor [Nitriliruptorales bacterium]